ncbi:MAG: cob(I)yrinic acid a,c-diamide adenosyltransferase [Deltaproteobacteria bacterium]
MNNHRGLVQIYTGDGKGKTSAAFGQALRAIGHGNKVCAIQFMKGRKYGECLATEMFFPKTFTIHLAGLDSFVMRGNLANIDIELAQGGLKIAHQMMTQGNYDMLILDEICVAIDFALIKLDDVVSFITNKPRTLELILTGRYAQSELIALADTVTDIKEVKHHYRNGLKEREGMEF